MKEIVDEKTVVMVINWIAVIGPLLGILIGFIVGKIRHQVRSDTIKGFVIGCFGILNWVMWNVYDRITNHYGLDTVKNLVVNLVVFVAVGIVVGIMLGFFWKKDSVDK